MTDANSKVLSRVMILALFVGAAFAFGAMILSASHDGSLFADVAAVAE